MSGPGPGDPRLWGRQHPFERTHLQRSIALLGLGAVFSVTVIMLVHGQMAGVLGVALVCAGLVCALAAASRLRYVRETRVGFRILERRDGRFVFESAAAFVLVSLLVLVLILR